MAEEETTKTATKQLKILEADEVEAVYGLPIFDDDDRAFYFALSPSEKGGLSQLHGLKSSIYYILQLGYFKARQQFFVFNLQQVAADAEYVQRTHFPDAVLVDLDIAKVTRLKQQSLILELLQYRVCGQEDRRQMRLQAQQMAQISSRPVYVFRELMAYLSRQRLVTPGYTVMQEMIGDVLQREKERLIAIAKSHLADDAVAALNDLLANPRGLYEITRIKREPKDFSIKEINKEIQRGEQIKSLYAVVQTVLPHLDISNESVKYYASLIDYYSVFQMSQLEKNLARIYLLCFVQYRYQRLDDNLINCFIYRVRQILDEAKSVAKERVYQYRLEHNRNLYKAGQALKLFADDTIPGETPFADVRTQVFAILPATKLTRVADNILQTAPLDEHLFQWEHTDQIANRFKRRLRPLLRAIDFSTTDANKSLITAVNFLKTVLQNTKPLTQYKPDKLPQRFITEQYKRYSYTANDAGEKQLLVDRYEFLIYRLLRNNLESGDVFVPPASATVALTMIC